MQQALQESVSGVLVYRVGSIGDLVTALPCLHLIRRRRIDAQIRPSSNQPRTTAYGQCRQMIRGQTVPKEVRWEA
jgi:hypothetical protein